MLTLWSILKLGAAFVVVPPTLLSPSVQPRVWTWCSLSWGCFTPSECVCVGVFLISFGYLYSDLSLI